MAFQDMFKIGDKSKWEVFAIWGIVALLILGVLLAVIFSFVGGSQFG